MPDSSAELDEIARILGSPDAGAGKPLAYAALLRLQERSVSDPDGIRALAGRSRGLISLLVADVREEDEETAVQAMKCLGFMIHHPTILASIPVGVAGGVLESLANVIITAKMKSVCNLGMWCISMQQFDGSLLNAHFQSLLKAIVHALDNPFGSLSTTFEAIQAVMKIASQLGEMMRDSSHIWTPPLYRRLLSTDKRERDMTERCLLKIKSIMLPPSLTLSKVLALDMKERLLTSMKEMLEQGFKVQTVRAWGWFIRLLGDHALRKRCLLNDMLKIPELTFSDQDVQVQIASQFAWEGIIDALTQPIVQAQRSNTTKEKQMQRAHGSRFDNDHSLSSGFLKSIKLIMTPLIGIISSKSDLSVHSSCFNTWCYLLHKLDIYVNHPLVRNLVLEPVVEAAFHGGPLIMRTWLCNLCLDLLDDSISAKLGNDEKDSDDQVGQHTSKMPNQGNLISGKFSWNQYPIKWLPWDPCQLDFYIQVIQTICEVSTASVAKSNEDRSMTCDAALRMFRSILKIIQMQFRSPSINYDDIMWILKRILMFVKKTCEDANLGCGDRKGIGFCHTSLPFIQAIFEQLPPSILGSPLYKMPLDLKYVENLESVDDFRRPLDIRDIAYMDMVSPVVYLIVLYYVVIQSHLDKSGVETTPWGSCKYMEIVLSSDDPSENLALINALLYKHANFSCLELWSAVAGGLKDHLNAADDPSLLQKGFNFSTIIHLLSYPFYVYSHHMEKIVDTNAADSSGEYLVSAPRKPEVGHLIEEWISLYGFVSTMDIQLPTPNTFHGLLCSILSECLKGNTSLLEHGSYLGSSSDNLAIDRISFCVNVLTYIVERNLKSEVRTDGMKAGSNSVLHFAARLMEMSMAKAESRSLVVLNSRVFHSLGELASCLHFKQDILSFVEIISPQLLQGLSLMESEWKSISDEVQFLWIETLNCSLRSQPPIMFDSSYLKIQACLLEKTLDHPIPSISNPAISYWNSTYGEQMKLDYPPSLLHVLDKLYRSGRIYLQKRSLSLLERCNALAEPPQRYKVTSTHNRTTKRVELVEVPKNQLEHMKEPLPKVKRKRSELTEHQKEVRRAQRGRERDCGMHGPGIRTYTSVDFSQGNDDSQESDIQNQESILDVLRRAY
ncbi:uncharacterized protein LOC115684187 isoform X1 [Syzygium oleosum]|uniref:uncharacterized protein LOC115684187 isoform X1 n=1 Tax=Syzygium oleosum TaxID=219896 RepID=UPI0011D19562|nr:uncharacterized protein LOC115684187 isoform X1 [Syzygium oleosum]